MNRRVSQRTHWHRVGIGLTLAVAIGLRVSRFLANDSFWSDEAALVVNLLSRDLAALASPLSNHQAAPYGFLVSQRAMAGFLGASEYTFRLLPLIAGCLSVPLFYLVGRRMLGRPYALFALALFAVSEPLVYYSAEAKYYAFDSFFALLLLLLTLLAVERPSTLRTILLALAGAIGVWVAHSTALVCGGLGLGGMWIRRMRGLPVLSSPFLLASVVWLASFGAAYFWVHSSATDSAYLRLYWDSAFIPFPPTSVEDLRWTLQCLFGVFSDPGGLEFEGLSAMAALIGGVSLYRRKREAFLLLELPLVLTLVASALRIYPFRLWSVDYYPPSGRLILFIVPALLIPLARGLEAAWGELQGKPRLTIYVAAMALLLHPTGDALVNALDAPRPKGMRPVVDFIGENARAGDYLYVYPGAEPEFETYTRLGYGPDFELRRLTRDQLDQHQGSAFLGSGDRIWVVFHYHPAWTSETSEALLMQELGGWCDAEGGLRNGGASAGLLSVR